MLKYISPSIPQNWRKKRKNMSLEDYPHPGDLGWRLPDNLRELKWIIIITQKNDSLKLHSSPLSAITTSYYSALLTGIFSINWVKNGNYFSFFCPSIPKGDLNTKKTTPIQKFALKASEPCQNIDILYVSYLQAQGIHGKRPIHLCYLCSDCTDFSSGNSVFRRNNLFSSFLALLMMLLTCSMFAQVNVGSFFGDQYPIDTFCAAYGLSATNARAFQPPDPSGSFFFKAFKLPFLCYSSKYSLKGKS